MKLSGAILYGSTTDVDIPTVETEEMQVFKSVLPTEPNDTF